MSREPQARDYLLAGILDVREGLLGDAVSRFALSIAARNFDIRRFHPRLESRFIPARKFG